MKGRDIIIVGQQAWDVEIGSNCKDIALEFSKHNRVLYVNAPLDRITRLRRSGTEKVKKRINIIKGKQNGLERIKENLWIYYPDEIIESINWIRSHRLFRLLNRNNSKRFASSIRKAIEILDFNDFILFNDSDMFRSFHLKELLNPTLMLYYSRDNMLATDYYRRHGKFIEPQIIKNSDLCVTNSPYLQRYCETFNKHSYYVGQGCDLTSFTRPLPLPVPNELINIKGPVVGYIGALTSARLDIDLIEYLAKNLSEFSIVLVGPEDEQFRKSNLHQLKNVFFLGSKKAEMLPDYIHAFDVCINPQLLNDLTVGNYPRKVDEYLAMGKPVVATRTETMAVFSDFTYLASTKEEFSELIRKAMLDNNFQLQTERKEFAFSHSWANSVEQIITGITKVEALKQARI